VLVLTSHLVGNPAAVDLRRRQAEWGGKLLQDLVKQEQQAVAIFCGDFNCTPDAEAPEACERHELRNAYKDCLRSDPVYTFRTDVTEGTMDYIFFRGMDVVDVGKLPTDHAPLPNDVYPSDHLALRADFRFR
jgi:endonuclease/exonuclease/phosphatase family metal-dependent hydrolase